MCSKKLQRKCINCSVWNFFPSSVEIISFLNTAWNELPNTTICTFPPCSFLSEVSYFYSYKRSKNLAMLENPLLNFISDDTNSFLIHIG